MHLGRSFLPFLFVLIAASAGATTSAATVKGQVKDADGKPVAGAKVYACRLDEEIRSFTVQAEVETDAEGKFSLEVPDADAPERSYCQHYAHKPGLAWGGTGISLQTEPIPESTITLLPPGNVSGRVLDRDGRPIEDAVVRPLVNVRLAHIYTHLSGAEGLLFLSASTDADGHFTLDSLPAAGTCSLHVEASGHATHFPHGPDQGQARNFAVPKDDIEVRLGPESRIEGILKHEETGKPIEGILLRLYMPRGGGTGYTRTDENGHFVLAGLTAGEYSFYGASRKDVGGVLTPGPMVTVAEGRTLKDVSLSWTEGVFVEGKVLDAESKAPVEGAYVSLSPVERGGRLSNCSGKSETNGSFRVRVVPGEHHLNLSKNGYVRISQRAVSVGEAAVTKLDDILIERLPVFNVIVEDENGKPVFGAQILRHQRSVATTDENGRAELTAERTPGWPGGDAYTVLSPDGSLVATMIPPDKEEKEIRVVLKKAGRLTGVVRKPDGTPLAGAKVQLIRITGNMSTQFGEAVTTDDEGAYTVSGLIPGGEYGVQASAAGYGQSQAWDNKYTVASGAATEAKPIALVAAEGKVSGRVVDPTGEPISGIQVHLYGRRQQQLQSLTGQDGRFEFENVVAENVRLSVQSRQSGYQPASLSLEPNALENVEVVLFPKFDPAAALHGGSPAPTLQGVEWVQGEWTGFGSLKGRRVVVAFISIKNRVCRKAIRDMLRSLSSVEDGGLQGVLVHDASASAEEIKTYLASEKIRLPTARVSSEAHLGWYSPAFAAFKVGALPTIVLVGADGEIESGKVPVGDLGARLSAAGK